MKTLALFVVALLLPALAGADAGDRLLLGRVLERRPDVVVVRGCVRMWSVFALDRAGNVCPPRAERLWAVLPPYEPGSVDVCAENQSTPMRRLVLADGTAIAAYPLGPCSARPAGQ